jgi:ATP-dependent protease ClpP protease subunit
MEEQDIIDPTYRGNIWCTPQERMDWRLYVTELGDDPKNHIEALDMIRTAEEEDTVEVLITSPGGYCNIADMYLAAFADSKAKIITRAIGECCSAATTIFLAGHERVCDDGCYFMFHNVQFGGLGGDSANVFGRTKFYERLFKEKSYHQMAEVLNKEELAELFDRAGEVYLSAAEMRERLQNSERRRETLNLPETVAGVWDGKPGAVMRFGDGNMLGYGITVSPEARGELTPKEWWDLVIKNPMRGTSTSTVSLPFPETKVRSATEFEQGDEFEITLDDGYKKTFRLSTLGPRDFAEYNTDEIVEMGQAFGADLSGMPYYQAVDALIEEIQNGGGEQ